MKIISLVICLITAFPLFGKPLLSDYGKNVYSQFGEDGIIEKIFEIIGTSSKIAVEFGAADGFALSNTANLWTKDPSWEAYLIESDEPSFNKMVSNIASYPCVAIHQKIGISSVDSLESILKKYNVPSVIDILSVDIDGNDYYIIENLEYLRPRLIICEYNPTLPAHLDIYPEYNNLLGCSVAALERIAKNKGYSLVAITLTNCFFVRTEDFPLFSEYETSRDKISINYCVRYLITDYTGNYRIIGPSDFQDPYGVNKPCRAPILGEITLLPFLNTEPK